MNTAGTVFRMTPAGALTKLVDFTGNGATNRGASPAAALVLGGDGNFYGSTANGGASNAGTVFRLRFEPDGSPTQLVGVGIEPGTGARIRWQAVPGQVSRVEYSDGPFGPWQPFAGTGAENGTGAIEYLDTTQPAPAKRFCRLATPL